ncbi:MAG: SpoIIE family protein phosphatase [Verrucomicrobia bacterium]|nr:SpoIIE family protein phosphatase [Verrucomicrobiota bacterium]MCH8528259.1 SpoIIE family protein phosphatase [Kiritimatiellia bacterium]
MSFVPPLIYPAQILTSVLSAMLVIGGAVSFVGCYFSIRVLRRIRIERDNLLKEKELIFNYVQATGDIFTESEGLSTERLLQRVLYFCLQTTHTAGGAVYLLGEDQQLRAHAISGVYPPLSGTKSKVGGLDLGMLKTEQLEELTLSTPVALGEGLVGQTADFGTPLLIERAERDPRVPHFDNSILNIRSLLMVPMRFRHEVMGVICVVNRVDGVPLSERDQSLLQAIADQASVSTYYAKFRTALDEKRRMDQDLHMAMRIQKGLLPRELPDIPGIDIHAFNLAAQEVGGDYYDVIPIDDDHVGLAIADVSGKGIGGALMMSICRSVLRAHAARITCPAEVLREVNRTMVADIYEDMFVTMIYMVYNIHSRELAIARAGHDPPILLQPNEKTVLREFGGGMAVGLVDADTFDATIETTRVTLEPGAWVVAYTDGITEAMNTDGDEWGIVPLTRVMISSRTLNAHQMCNNIKERVLRFTGEAPQYDDMTLMAFRLRT